MLDYMLVKEVRNAFFHSDYILYQETFNIKQGKGVLVDNVITKSIPLEWLIPKLKLGINFALATIGHVVDFLGSYQEEKIIPARILQNGGVENVLLTVHPNFGLKGFRTLTEDDKKKYYGNA